MKVTVTVTVNWKRQGLPKGTTFHPIKPGFLYDHPSLSAFIKFVFFFARNPFWQVLYLSNKWMRLEQSGFQGIIIFPEF